MDDDYDHDPGKVPDQPLVVRDAEGVPKTAEDEIGTEIALGRPVDAVAGTLAEKWGIDVAIVAKRVSRFMSERSARVITRMRSNIPEIYDEHRSRFTLILRHAMEKKTADGRAVPNLNVALKAAVALAQLDGFLTPKQMEMTAGIRANQIPTIEDVEFMRQVNAVLEDQRKRPAEDMDDDIIDV